jgi:hypothetical protein
MLDFDEAGALLTIFADALNDLESVRIATANRLNALTADPPWGKGLAGTPEAERMAGMVEALAQLEHQAELELRRTVRKHPLGPWIKRTIGVGEKQGARLLAAIGDPTWNAAADRPRRGPAELWAYCGLHVLHPDQNGSDPQACPVGVQSLSDPGQRISGDQLAPAGVGPSSPVDQRFHDTRKEGVGGGPSDAADQSLRDTHIIPVGGVAPKRRRGQRSNWNAEARMRVWLVAQSCIKNTNSPYRSVYDARRERTAETHPEWTPGHSHNDALRIVAKAIVKDLWREARSLRASLRATPEVPSPAAPPAENVA